MYFLFQHNSMQIYLCKGNPPVVLINPRNAFVSLAANASLTCEVEEASFYYWEREKDVLLSNAIGVNTNTLTLINIQSEDIGNYRCVATNGSGSSKSNYVAVTINSKATYFCICTYVQLYVTVAQQIVLCTQLYSYIIQLYTLQPWLFIFNSTWLFYNQLLPITSKSLDFT